MVYIKLFIKYKGWSTNHSSS